MTDDRDPPFEVPHSKIVGYLLNGDHPTGGSKARFFLAFGFDPARPIVMAEALIAHATDVRTTLHRTEAAGRRRMIAEGPMNVPDGREPQVRTVWQRHETGRWHLVTAVPLTRARPGVIDD